MSLLVKPDEKNQGAAGSTVEPILGFLALLQKTIVLKIGGAEVVMATILDFDSTCQWLEVNLIAAPKNWRTQYLNKVVEILAPEEPSVWKASGRISCIDHQKIRIDLPEVWVLDNSRRHRRYDLKRYLVTASFSRINPLCGRSETWSDSGAILISVATGGICLSIHRDENLLLPGDVISDLTLGKGGSPLLKVKARVAWVSRDASSGAHSRTRVGFEVLDLNSVGSLAAEPPVAYRRSLERVETNTNKIAAFLRFEHPLFDDGFFRCTVRDITVLGASVAIGNGHEKLIPGLKIKGAILQLRFERPIAVDLTIRHIFVHKHGIDQGSQETIVGVEFSGLSDVAIKTITSFIIATRKSELQEANISDIEEVWKFFFQSKFIYEKKRRLLQRQFGGVSDTYRRLLDDDSGLFRKLIYRIDNKIVAHVSAFQHYEHTWLIQHLAAKRDGLKLKSVDIINGIIDIFVQMSELRIANARFCQFFYRPDNIYPDAVFGSSTKLINDTSKAIIRTYEYLQYKRPENRSAVVAGYKLDRISGKDQILLDDILQRECTPLELRAESLFWPELELPITSSRYSGFGVERGREVLFNPDLGLAIIEFSNFGLSFSNLTNAIRIFPVTKQAAEPLAVLASEAALARHPEGEHVVLVRGQEMARDLSGSYIQRNRYNCWTLDLEFAKEFQSAVGSVFEDLRSYMRARMEKE